jgi:solute carrier family 35 protein F5
MFADNTFSKPFFVTYVNTSFFIIPLIPTIAKRFYRLQRAGKLSQITSIRSLLSELDAPKKHQEEDPFLKADEEESNDGLGQHSPAEQLLDSQPAGVEATLDESSEKLGLKATAKLSLEFCMLWVSR